MDPSFWKVMREASFWIWIPLFLWLTQVWSIWGGKFSMEVTMLQLPFVFVFQVVIFLIARERVREKAESGPLID